MSTLGGGDLTVTIEGDLLMTSSTGATTLGSGTGFNTNLFPGTAGNGNMTLNILGNVIANSGGGVASGSGFDALGNLIVNIGGDAVFQVVNGTGGDSGVALRSAADSVFFTARSATFNGNSGTPQFSDVFAAGDVFLQTTQDLNFNHAQVIGQNIELVANNINFTDGTTLTSSLELLARAAQDINMQASFASGGEIIFVVDDAFPSPFIGTGALFIDNASIFTSPNAISLYTAQQSLNSINGLFNGSLFSPGPIFVDTDREIWCTYYPNGNPVFPFTVFYKDCIELLANQATIVVDEMLEKFHGFDENPGWETRFLFSSDLSEDGFQNPYLIRRRHLSAVNQPKTWTVLLPE